MKKIILLLTTIIFCYGCSDSEQSLQVNGDPVIRDVFAMDTYMNLKVYGADAEAAANEAAEKISELEALLSVTDENSDIWKINHAGGKAVTVSEETLKIVDAAVDIGKKSGGALDITVYPVLKEWGFTTGDYKIPEAQTLADLLENVDYTRIEIDDGSIKIPEEYEIDLGALAKGYTGDKLMEIFREHGVESAIVSLGGNVQALGKKPDGTLWNVAVADPFAPETDICIVSIEDKAVITSGNYERYFTGDDGKEYWHIIDAADGYPADNGLVSVTVIGSSGLICDALSTALFIEGLDGAEEFWKKSDYDFDMVLVTDDAKVYITEGIEENFQPTGNMIPEVIRND